MPEVYTVGRKIELMTKVEGEEGIVSFKPSPKWLAPLTKCDVTENALFVHGLPYVKVKVCAGSHDGQAGYIARYGVFQGYVTKLLMKDGAVVAEGGAPAFTGIKYGAYKAQTDYKALLWAKQNTCKRCGKVRGDHKLLETIQVRNDLLDIMDFFRSEGKHPHKFPRVGRGEPFMMGLLTDGAGKRWFAMSTKGEQLGSPPAVAKDYCDANKIVFVQGKDIDTKFLDFNGETIVTSDGAEEPYKPNAQCAAPKCIQYVLQKEKEKPKVLYLSEIWFGKKKEHELYPDKATIDSCDFCRLAIPPMLCGYVNPYKKSSLGRPGDWKSIGQLV